MASRFVAESSDDLPSHLQWTMSKDVFQKVLSGASWFSRSTINSRAAEKQPLLARRNYSCNELYGGKNRHDTITASFTRPGGITSSRSIRPFWPSYGDLLWNLHPHDTVTISDVCRTATPLIPPILEEAEEGVSWISAAFLLMNAALGIGILNFPAAYDLAGGIIPATITQILMLILIVISMLILAHCSDVNLDVTYHDVLLSMCGRSAQKLAALSITCTCYGVCVAIFIIIGDQLDRLFLAIVGSDFCHYWYLERHFTIPVAGILFILPICYFKRVDFLRYAGSLGLFAMLYPIFLTVYGYFALEVKNVEIKTQPDSVSKFLVVVPVLCFAYQCQEVVVPVYACLKVRTLPNMARSCCLCMGALLLLYSTIGCFGYLTFGGDVSTNVMRMYDASDPVVAVGIVALVLKIIVTYPVLAMCGRGAVDGLYSEFFRLSAMEFLSGERRRRFIIATVWFTTSLVIALYTTSIGTVIHALGSISSANIFIYPGICLIRVTLQRDPDLKRTKSYFIIAGAIFLVGIGAFFFGIILTDSILHGAGGNPEEKLCI